MKDQFSLTDILTKNFVDTANTRPQINYPLNYIGMSNRPHYISVIDPFQPKNKIRLFTKLTALISLDAMQKGLHVSRVERALHEMEEKNNLSFLKYTQELAKLIQAKQTKNTDNCKVSLAAEYEKESKNNISGKPSHEIFKLFSEYETKDKQSTIGILAPVINACPCAQKWGMREFYQKLANSQFSEAEIIDLIKKAPRQTHTNRGEIRLLIGSDKINFQDLYNIIEKSSPILRELLDSQDEHSLISQAQLNGMFCEDVARAVIYNTFLFAKKKKLNPKTKISLTVEVDESIHYHNMYAQVNATLEEIEIELRK